MVLRGFLFFFGPTWSVGSRWEIPPCRSPMPRSGMREAVVRRWMEGRKTVVEIGVCEKTLARLKTDIFPWLGKDRSQRSTRAKNKTGFRGDTRKLRLQCTPSHVRMPQCGQRT